MLSSLCIILGFLSPPDTAHTRQYLPEVTVRAHTRPALWSPPGESRGLHTAFGQTIWPTRTVAVWHGPPDTTRHYRVRAVRVRIGSRMPERMADLPTARRNLPEGRLQLWLSPGTTTAGPDAGRNLLNQKLLVTAETGLARKGWVRFEVADQRLAVPAGGLFVVVQGLTTTAEQTFVRRRTLAAPYTGQGEPQELDFRKIRSGSSMRSYQYEEVHAADGRMQLLATNLFPTLAYRQVDKPVDCHTWVLSGRQGQPTWQTITQELAPARRANPNMDFHDYNYEVELEVEEY